VEIRRHQLMAIRRRSRQFTRTCIYLLSNSTVGTAWPMGACALTPNYAGHAFWDSDSWVFPSLLLLHPERAKPIVMFRHRTCNRLGERARQYGVRGTMYPWDADPQTGVDHTPHFAYGRL